MIITSENEVAQENKIKDNIKVAFPGGMRIEK
jgi:hypothetical protein